MSSRALLALLVLGSTLLLSGCAASATARRFEPAGPQEVQEALAAWSAARDRASSLPPSRLLYDAHMGTSGLPSVPGTLAVSYDGRRIVAASLTGPFGSRIAEYGEGRVTGEDRKAFVVDPEALRSVLAGVWAGDPGSVAGCNGADCLLSWDGTYRADAVLDRTERRLRSLSLTGNGGSLSVAYSGRIEPWPERIALKEAKSGRSLSLLLIATEPVSLTPPTTPTPGPPPEAGP